MIDVSNRGQFLNVAGAFMAGLVIVALLIGWLVDVNPLASLVWEWTAISWGVLAAIPLFVLFAISYRYPLGPMIEIKRQVTEILGPLLSVCRWYDLVLLSLLVGFSEELLFRGVLQAWLQAWGPLFGLLASNVIFGLAHLVTPFYALLAGVIGCYLGLLFDATGQRNLLTPLVTHAVYDYLAFLVVVRAFRAQSAKSDKPRTAEDVGWRGNGPSG